MRSDSVVLMIIVVSLTCLTFGALAADPARIEVRPGEEIGRVNRLAVARTTTIGSAPSARWRCVKPGDRKEVLETLKRIIAVTEQVKTDFDSSGHP